MVKIRNMLITFSMLIIILTACIPAQTIVPEGQVHYILNPKYDPRTSMTIKEKYSKIWGAGDTYNEYATEYENKTIHKVEVAYITRAEDGTPQIGLYGNEVLPMGLYREIPSEDVRIVRAAVIAENYIGIYVQQGVEVPEYIILSPGEQKVPESMVSTYPSTLQRYRTLGGGAWEAFSTGDPAPCQSIACETSITNVSLKGTDILASVDLDVNFKFLTDQKYAKRLKELGTPDQAIQNWIATPIRSFIRSAGSTFTPQEYANFDNRLTFENMILSELQRATKGEPIFFESVKIRSIIIGSEEYRTRLERLASDLEAAKQQGQLLEQAKLNSNLQFQATATASALEQQLNIARTDAQVEALRKMIELLQSANINMDWQTVWILLHAGEQNPTFSPFAMPTPTPQPPQP